MLNATLEKSFLGNRLNPDSDEGGFYIPNLVDEFTQRAPPSGMKKIKFRTINRGGGEDLIARLENAESFEKPAMRVISSTANTAEKAPEKTFSAAASQSSPVSSPLNLSPNSPLSSSSNSRTNPSPSSSSISPARKFGESPDALRNLISGLRKGREKINDALPAETRQSSASGSTSEGIHIERYDRKSQYDVLRDMSSGRDRTYATLKEFMQNTLEKKLEKINSSEIIFKIDSAPQLVNYCLDFEKKVADKRKRSKNISESFERQVSEMRESLKIRISNALGDDYYNVLRSVIDRDEKFYSMHPELSPASLGSKVSIYSAVNRALEAKTRGMFLPRISENRIRSEVTNLSEIMYGGKNWTQRVENLQNALRQIYNSGKKCALNDRELLAVSLIRNELANNRYIHGKKVEHRDEEGSLQVTYTGIRKTREMRDATNYLRFNTKVKSVLNGLDSLVAEENCILSWPSVAASKLSDTFSETVTTVEETCHKVVQTVEKTLTESIDTVEDNFKQGYSLANTRVAKGMANLTASASIVLNKTYSTVAAYAKKAGKSVNEFLAEDYSVIAAYAKKAGKSVSEFLTEYYNASASKYKPENMIGKIESGTVTLQSLVEGIRMPRISAKMPAVLTADLVLPRLSLPKVNLPKLSDYAINTDYVKNGAKAVKYGALAASLIFTLYTSKLLGNVAVTAYHQWQHRQVASQELTPEQRAQRIVTGFEAAKKHSQELIAIQQANLERIAKEEYQKKQTAYAAERQHMIDTYQSFPVKNWQSKLTGWPGRRLNPFNRRACRRIMNSGQRAPGWCWEHHDGFDINGDKGDSEFAFDKGIVIHAGWIGGYGNAVIILHPNGYSTLYGHGKVNGLKVKVGQEVERGQLVMLMGSTGYSTGNHLHFELRDSNGKTLNALNKDVMNAYLGPETLEQLANVGYIKDPTKISVPAYLWKGGHVSKNTADAANTYLKKHAETAQKYSAAPQKMFGSGSIGPKHGISAQETR